MKVKIRTDGFKGWAERGRLRAEALTRGEPVQPEITINFESPSDMLQVMTPECIRLCETARGGSYSISALAAALGRDPKSVRRDIHKLMSFGLLRTREQVNPGHGRIKIVEPVAKTFSLRASF